MKSSHVLGWTMATALVALILYVISRGSPIASAGDGADGERSERQALNAGGASRTPPEDPGGAEGGIHRKVPPQPTDTASTLRIDVVHADGKAAKGTITWRCSPDPAVCGDTLPMIHGQAQGSVRQVSFEQTATIHPSAGQWTWIRISARGDPLRGWYLRVAPFTGIEERRMVLATDRRVLHIFAWNHDLTGPASEREIKIFGLDLGTGGAPTALCTVKTDRHGYAVARDLPPGGFRVCGPGGDMQDRHPHAAQLMMPERLGVPELTCTVVAVPDMTQVTLRIEADQNIAADDKGAAGSAAGTRNAATKLYLKRKDGSNSEAYPVTGVVESGQFSRIVRVPPGTYEVGCLPLGALKITGTEPFFEVEPGQPRVVSLRLEPVAASTELVLQGIPASHLPITVHPRRAEGLIDEDDRIFFTGSYRWQATHARVPALPGRRRLVVHTRRGPFLADTTCVLSGGTVNVAVSAATRLHLKWLGPRAAPCDGALLVVRTPQGETISTTQRSLVRHGSTLLAARQASVVVPQGEAEVECRSPRGDLLWRRTVQAIGASVIVEVME